MKNFKGSCHELKIAALLLQSWKYLFLFHKLDIEHIYIVELISHLIDIETKEHKDMSTKKEILGHALLISVYINLHYENNDMPCECVGLMSKCLNKTDQKEISKILSPNIHFIIHEGAAHDKQENENEI